MLFYLGTLVNIVTMQDGTIWHIHFPPLHHPDQKLYTSKWPQILDPSYPTLIQLQHIINPPPSTVPLPITQARG